MIDDAIKDLFDIRGPVIEAPLKYAALYDRADILAQGVDIRGGDYVPGFLRSKQLPFASGHDSIRRKAAVLLPHICGKRAI
jgi:hypothetical protein